MLADRSTFFLNPLRRDPVWAFSLRENLCRGGPSRHMRARRLFEAPHAEAPLRRIAMRGGRPLSARAQRRRREKALRSLFLF